MTEEMVMKFSMMYELMGEVLIMMQNAIPRCENCGWKMNENVCPKCGFVQS